MSSGKFCRAKDENDNYVWDCHPKKPNGWGCSVDSQCASNVCQVGKCRECRNHNQCSGGRNFVVKKMIHNRVVWNCHNKKPNNWGCPSNHIVNVQVDVVRVGGSHKCVVLI